eukprot:7380505-Prymnesium_polylepis.2
MHTVHRGIMTSESVTAALSAPACTGLFEASSMAVRRSCHAPQAGTLLHLSLIGPFEFSRNRSRIDLTFSDVFDLRQTLRERDVVAHALFVAPVDRSANVLSNPPINPHHVNVYVEDTSSYMFGPAEESQCVSHLSARRVTAHDSEMKLLCSHAAPLRQTLLA